MIHNVSVQSVLRAAASRIKNDEAAFESQLLLQQALKVNRAWLIVHADDTLSASGYAEFEALLLRRIQGEPIAYILGEREFYGLKLKVTPDTLIPRPDTETLVEAALAKIPDTSDFQLLDLGTGSGAVALAIAKHRPNTRVVAVDVSAGALEVAAENAQHLSIANIRFILSDWFSALRNQHFDMIVSNPPYIENNDTHLTQGDLRFEPLSALASGEDGLDDLRKIISFAPQYLKPHGWLMLEHGYDQAGHVITLLQAAGFTKTQHRLDLAGIQRVSMGCLE